MKPDLEKDLLSNNTIVEKCKNSEVYSQNLYAALCNNRFFYGNDEWTCSWRYAGGIVSEINNGNDYMDYYCSGIGNIKGFVIEGFVTDEIRTDLIKLGWIVKPYESESRS
jgi:hypothetical protein